MDSCGKSGNGGVNNCANVSLKIPQRILPGIDCKSVCFQEINAIRYVVLSLSSFELGQLKLSFLVLHLSFRECIKYLTASENSY